MSKSSMVMMFVLLVGFGSMLLAADLVLDPIERDIGLARELIADLDHRGWLAPDKPKPDNRVRVRSLRGDDVERDPSRTGWGLIVEVRPATETLSEKHRLQAMTGVVLQRIDAAGATSGRSYDWIELVILTDDAEVLRTLIGSNQGGWAAPRPPIPEALIPNGQVPQAPRRGGGKSQPKTKEQSGPDRK